MTTLRRGSFATAIVLVCVFAMTSPVHGASMRLTSSAFSQGQPIPVKYTCDGEDVSPPLTVANAPRKTVELVLTVEDPDAPGGTFVHWLLYNVKGSTKTIAEGRTPPGSRQGTNSFGSAQWRGPCPPAFQTHRYFFYLHALSKPSGLPPGADAGAVQQALKGKVIAHAHLMGTYGCALLDCLVN